MTEETTDTRINVWFSKEELPLLGRLLEKGYVDAEILNPRQTMLQAKMKDYGFDVDTKSALTDRDARAYLYRRFQIGLANAMKQEEIRAEELAKEEVSEQAREIELEEALESGNLELFFEDALVLAD